MLIVRENALASGEGLEALRQLEHVALDVNRLTDLRGVAGLHCLRILEAQNNAILVLSNDMFRGCDALERLVWVWVWVWVVCWCGCGCVRILIFLVICAHTQVLYRNSIC